MFRASKFSSKKSMIGEGVGSPDLIRDIEVLKDWRLRVGPVIDEYGRRITTAETLIAVRY